MSCQILHGDCRHILPTIGDATIDAIITDPPYELGFMGKRWDATGIAYDLTVWAECLRVLKPGGHLLAFGGTRTYHRMACAIEDAGFEIRDSIHWLYGSGFPKSLDVSKAIDKANGRKFEDRYPLAEHIRAKRKAAGLTCADVNAWFGYSTACQHWESQHPGGARVPNIRDWQLLKGRLGLSSDWDELVARIEAEREVVGSRDAAEFVFAPGEARTAEKVTLDITAPATDAARQWEGWGTALKPAHEPIIVARKPLDGTVAANVLAHGTGALNIDGCRIDEARWPANVVIDPHIAEQHPEWANYYYCPKASTTERNTGLDGLPEGQPINGADKWTEQDRRRGEGVTRKPSANTHPTVKPLNLMRWLVRLVTPPDGTVLDPFAGSGTTLTAAILEHFNTIGIELTDEYHPIIHARTAWAQTQTDGQLPL